MNLTVQALAIRGPVREKHVSYIQCVHYIYICIYIYIERARERESESESESERERDVCTYIHHTCVQTNL